METIFIGVINVVKSLTAVTVNVLLMMTSPFEIPRYEISSPCAHLCLQE
jgi:hypothetical protein